MIKPLMRLLVRRLKDKDLDFISQSLRPRQRKLLKEALECPKLTKT